jgi:hypothetical protein
MRWLTLPRTVTCRSIVLVLLVASLEICVSAVPDITAGTAGLAIELNGVDAVLEVADDCERDPAKKTNCSSIGGLEKFTVSAWIKSGQLAGQNGTILYKGNGAQGEFHVAVNSNGDLLVELGNSTGSWSFSWLVPGIVSFDVWRHFAVSWDGSTVNVYQNGSLTHTRSYSGAFSRFVSSSPLLIGAAIDENQMNTQFFNGSVDEIRIYCTRPHCMKALM